MSFTPAMSSKTRNAFDAVLSPFERGGEIVFGILMAVSVTAATEIAASGETGVRQLMVAALACNLAWGIIDAAMFLLQQQFERFRNHRTMLELRAIAPEDAFRERVRAELPPLLGPTLTPDTLARIRVVVQSYSQRRPPFWSLQEFGVAGIICALVFGSTFLLVVPFMVLQDPWLALRGSHAVAVVMLFLIGWRIGRWSGASALGSGAAFAAAGAALAVLCVALGG
jgi:hypothetical protein